MGDERGCGHAALDQAGRALGLDDRSLTGPAGVLREDRSLHPHEGRDHVESLARLLTDPMQRTGAAGADRGLGLDHLLAPRQVLGKRADVAHRRPAGDPLALGPALIVGGRWRRVGPTARSSRSSGSWATSITAARSERAPKEILQGPHDRPQALVLRIQRQHHRNQASRVGGHILRADRHT